MATPLRPLLLAAASLVFAGSLFSQSVLYTLTLPLELNNVTSDSNQAFGNEFTVSALSYANGIDVVSLGAFDYAAIGSPSLNHIGFVNDQSVKLWTDAGTLLASATISAAPGANNDFVFTSITPVHLAPGDYVLTVYSNTSGTFRDGRLVFQSFTPASGISFGSRLASFNSGDIFPTQDSGASTIHIGPNLMFNATPVVPEPSAYALLAGLAGLALAAAYRRCGR